MNTACTRQERLAQMLALVPRSAAPIPPTPKRSKRMQEVMTNHDTHTGLEYPQVPQDDAQRARMLRLMDSYYPEDAPHYWRDYELSFFSSESTPLAANEPTPPEVFAPVPLMTQISEMAALPDGSRVLRSTRYEPKGMRQATLLAIAVLVLTAAGIFGKAFGAL